jgi:DNA mismatch endonuclease (patch repair protein)
MPRKDTGPEVLVRRALHRLGLRYRVNYRGLPGTPDVVFTRARIALFVDGCFWHRCPDHGVIPKANRQWWSDKLQTTVERDGRKDSELEAAGWLPVHVWEHEDPDQVAERVEELWRTRTRQ